MLETLTTKKQKVTVMRSSASIQTRMTCPRTRCIQLAMKFTLTSLFLNIPGVLGDVLVELLKVHCSTFVAHRNRVVVRARKLFRVPRVDNDTPVEALGGTRELGQDQCALALHLRGDVFERHEVHSVPRGRDHAGIRCRVQSDQLVEAYGLVHEMDGHVIHRSCRLRSARHSCCQALPVELRLTKLPVDSPHELVHDRPQVLILLHILSARHRDLDQNHLSDPLRVLGEEDFQGV